MFITILQIDPKAMEMRGYTPTASYPVYFRSSAVTGWARLVPFGEDPMEYIGESLIVEIGQESVTGLRKSLEAGLSESIEPLPADGDFRVHGTSVDRERYNDPPGSVSLTVRSGEAQFSLSGLEQTYAGMAAGDMIVFDVHDVSLWDEML